MTTILVLALLSWIVLAAAPAPTGDEFTREGLRLWLRAGEGVTAGADGKVSLWSDQSGRAHHLKQEQVLSMPLLVERALNGYSVIRFDGYEARIGGKDGREDYLEGQIGPLELPVTVFAVSKFNNLTQTFGTDFADYIWNIGQGCSDNLSFARVSGNARTLKNVYLCLYGLSCSHEGHLMGNPLEGGKFLISASVFRADRSHTFYVNGEIHSFLLKLPGDVKLSGTVNLGRFNEARAPNALDGEIAEILMYAREFSDEERGQVESYLRKKFALN